MIALLLLGACGCPEEAPLPGPMELREQDVLDVLALEGVEDRTALSCETFCRYAVETFARWGRVLSIERCTLTLDPEPGQQPIDPVGELVCEGVGEPRCDTG